MYQRILTLCYVAFLKSLSYNSKCMQKMQYLEEIYKVSDQIEGADLVDM